MKKSVLLGAVALAFASSSAFAQTAEIVEVYESVNQYGQIDQWVGDCTQGRLINKNKDNWFITLEGGANMLFGKGDIHADIKDRIDGNGAIYFGKWVTPTFGFRFGANYIMTKGATQYGGDFQKWNDASQLVKGDETQNGWYSEKWMGLGPEFDVLISLTNWWCGYRPGRVYNAVLHGGAGAYWRWRYNQNGPTEIVNGLAFYPESKWHGAHNTILFATLGLQQNFRLSKHVDFFIDLQYQLLNTYQPVQQGADVYLGFNFNLGKTGWDCPVVPVCADVTPLLEKINVLEENVAVQRKKIKELEDALRDLEGRPQPKAPEVNCSGLVTIYYPINQSSLSPREKTVLQAVADVMLNNPNQKYKLLGWADNYTGDAKYNNDLRWLRVNGVKNYLISRGVPADQLVVDIDDQDLMKTGEYNEFKAYDVEIKSAPLDRAVTIRLAD